MESHPSFEDFSPSILGGLFFFLEALSLLLGFQPFVNFELGYTQRKAFVGIDFNY